MKIIPNSWTLKECIFHLYWYGLFRFWSTYQVSNDSAFYFNIGKNKNISNFTFLLSLYYKRFESIYHCLIQWNIKTYLTNWMWNVHFKKNIFNLIFPTSKKSFPCKLFTLSFELNSMHNDCSTYYSYHISDKELYNVIPC